jgi:hypothetical protein
MMDRPLFVYGTLRDPDLLSAVLGRAVPAPMQLCAVAPGCVALGHRNGRKAALVRVPGGMAQGLLVLGLSTFEADLLDAFVGGDYCRSVVAVMVAEELHEAAAYLPRVEVPRPGEAWSLSRWQQQHKSHAFAACAATAAELRDKLIALRPN